MTKESRESVIEQLSQVKFVGPAKAADFFDELGIASVAQLIDAARDSRLQTVKGVGASTEARILEAALAVAPAPREDEGAAAETSAHDEVDDAAQASQGEVASAADTAHPAEPAEDSDQQQPAEASEQTSAPEVLSDTPLTAIERFIDALRCPSCGNDSFVQGPTSLTCNACHREYTFQNGIADLAPPRTNGGGVTQRIMESRVYARFYEDLMRPKLTSLVSGRSMDEEYALSTELLDLQDDTRLLDVACGTGNFTRHFADFLHAQFDDAPATLVTGMDLSWPMLETARTYLRRDGLEEDIYLIRGDASRIPARRGAFNRLHCAGALHLIPRVDEVLRNFARVLEPGGVCVIATFRMGESNALQRLLKRAAELPTQFHWFTEEELRARLDRAGFDMVHADAQDDALTVKAIRKS